MRVSWCVKCRKFDDDLLLAPKGACRPDVAPSPDFQTQIKSATIFSPLLALVQRVDQLHFMPS